MYFDKTIIKCRLDDEMNSLVYPGTGGYFRPTRVPATQPNRIFRSHDCTLLWTVFRESNKA